MAQHDLLLDYLTSFEEGRAILSHGNWEWELKTRSTPVEIMVGETDGGHMPVCNGGVNTYGTYIVPGGFVLIAHIVTEHSEIRWQAILGG